MSRTLDYPLSPCSFELEVGESMEPIPSFVIWPAVPIWGSSVKLSPLLERGWVLQERAMSRRILHFAKHCVYWECQELKASEFRPSGPEDENDRQFLKKDEQIMNLQQFIGSSREAKLGQD